MQAAAQLPLPLAVQQERLDGYRFTTRVLERGIVASVGDGIAWITGLPSAAMDELLLFEDGSRGMVFHLGQEALGAILLYQTLDMAAGTLVHLTARPLSVPVGPALLGRVVDPLGMPLDGGAPPVCQRQWRMDVGAPPIVMRDFVREPLYTGCRIADTMIPIGKGQRELLIGDEGLGRSSFAIDTVINQKGKNVRCVYVLIGQKRTSVLYTLEVLESAGAMEYTTIVVGEASALPGLKFIAPFAGCAIAEAWMHEGCDTLVIYDDLSAHARAYRELSLLLRRPPGREAYPGDIFFLHARLLERATCLGASHGGGSMTALPVVETQQGEIAAYIPTNLISITDGQIYFDRTLFESGVRPAIQAANSVSRIGGRAQHQRIKEEAGRMKLDYLQFMELEVFTRFGARLESAMELALKRGRILRELLKQEQLAPETIELQMAWLVAFNEHWFDDVALEDIPRVMKRLAEHCAASGLALEDAREAWVRAVRDWVAPPAGGAQ